MTGLRRREIERRLRELGASEVPPPPAGLVERIRAEIPDDLASLSRLDEEARSPQPGRERGGAGGGGWRTHRWRIAAALVMTVGAGAALWWLRQGGGELGPRQERAAFSVPAAPAAPVEPPARDGLTGAAASPPLSPKLPGGRARASAGAGEGASVALRGSSRTAGGRPGSGRRRHGAGRGSDAAGATGVGGGAQGDDPIRTATGRRPGPATSAERDSERRPEADRATAGGAVEGQAEEPEVVAIAEPTGPAAVGESKTNGGATSSGAQSPPAGTAAASGREEERRQNERWRPSPLPERPAERRRPNCSRRWPARPRPKRRRRSPRRRCDLRR